jgi:hypothetical protein
LLHPFPLLPLAAPSLAACCSLATFSSIFISLCTCRQEDAARVTSTSYRHHAIHHDPCATNRRVLGRQPHTRSLTCP